MSEMKAYNVKVNGKKYFIEIEEAVTQTPFSINKGYTDPYNARVPVPPATSFAEPAPGTSIPDPVPAEPGACIKLVTSPLHGTVLSVNVKLADHVLKGDLLMTIAAMNKVIEILAEADGIVTQILAVRGKAVETGDVLFIM